MALHSRYAVTVSAAVATRSRADCSSMEDRRRKYLTRAVLRLVWPLSSSEDIRGHTSLSAALVVSSTVPLRNA